MIFLDFYQPPSSFIIFPVSIPCVVFQWYCNNFCLEALFVICSYFLSRPCPREWKSLILFYSNQVVLTETNLIIWPTKSKATTQKFYSTASSQYKLSVEQLTRRDVVVPLFALKSSLLLEDGYIL